MRRLLIPLALTATLLLSACSGGEEPIALPADPPDAQLLDAASVETQLDIILLSVHQVTDVPVSWERLYDVTDTGATALIEHYDEELSAQGWERVQGTVAIDRSLGASWQRGEQDVVIALLTLDGTDVAAVLVSPEGR